MFLQFFRSFLFWTWFRYLIIEETKVQKLPTSATPEKIKSSAGPNAYIHSMQLQATKASPIFFFTFLKLWVDLNTVVLNSYAMLVNNHVVNKFFSASNWKR